MMAMAGDAVALLLAYCDYDAGGRMLMFNGCGDYDGGDGVLVMMMGCTGASTRTVRIRGASLVGKPIITTH